MIQYLQAFEVAGCKVIRVTHGGKHMQLTVAHADHTHLFIAPVSPSDRRGVLNFKSDVRKWVRSLTERKLDECH
jgi:hypothetical protein